MYVSSRVRPGQGRATHTSISCPKEEKWAQDGPGASEGTDGNSVLAQPPTSRDMLSAWQQLPSQMPWALWAVSEPE